MTFRPSHSFPHDRSLHARGDESGRSQPHFDEWNFGASHFFRVRDAIAIPSFARKSSHHSGKSILGEEKNQSFDNMTNPWCNIILTLEHYVECGWQKRDLYEISRQVGTIPKGPDGTALCSSYANRLVQYIMPRVICKLCVFVDFFSPPPWITASCLLLNIFNLVGSTKRISFLWETHWWIWRVSRPMAC